MGQDVLENVVAGSDNSKDLNDHINTVHHDPAVVLKLLSGFLGAGVVHQRDEQVAASHLGEGALEQVPKEPNLTDVKGGHEGVFANAFRKPAVHPVFRERRVHKVGLHPTKLSGTSMSQDFLPAAVSMRIQHGHLHPRIAGQGDVILQFFTLELKINMKLYIQ